MVNENIQGPVQLSGKGFFRKPSNNYEPGEYHDLQNLIITDAGTLKQRPPFQGLRHNVFDRVNNFVGNKNGTAIAAYSTPSTDTPRVFVCKDTIAEGKTYSTFNDYVLPLLDTATAGLGTGAITRKRTTLEGYFLYNNKEYALYWHSFHRDVTVSQTDYYGALVLVEAPERDDDELSALFDASSVASPIVFSVRLMDIESPNFYDDLISQDIPAYPKKPINGWIMHKERLWVASQDTVYFSAATDPLNWAVPSGGFFRFSGKQIKDIVSLGDTVYVIFDHSISVITYQTDPNVDSSVSEIGGAVGGDGSCLYSDSVYVIKNDSIYVLNGHNIDKVMDLSLSLREKYSEPNTNANDADGLPIVSGKTFEYKMVGFDGALYILPRHIVLNGEILDTPWYCSPFEYHYSNSESAYTSGGLFRVSLNNGSVSRYLVKDNQIPSDIMFLGYEDRFNQQKLMMSFNHHTIPANKLGFIGSSSKFWYSMTDVNGFDRNVVYYHLDQYSNADGTSLEVYPIMVFLRIMNFSPDNMHWLIKKFRNIIINGDFPRFWDGTVMVDITRLRVAVGAYSNDSVVSSNVIIDELLTQYTPPPALESLISVKEPRSYRYGLNQRTKNVSIILSSEPSLVPSLRPLSDYTTEADRIQRLHESNMEITDIRTLWSYIGRGPTNDPNDVS